MTQQGTSVLRDEQTDAGPSVVLFSQRNATRKVWQASQYEFEDVIASVSDAHVVSPGGGDVSDLGRMRRQALNRVRRRAGRPRLAAMTPTGVEAEADLFVAVFATGHDLAYLPRLTGWQERCRTKVAYVVEWWRSQVPSTTDYLRLLADFDHVFVFSRGIVPHIERVADVRVSYLPLATDMTLFAPGTPSPQRHIDVISYGRTMPGTHRALVHSLEQRRLFYHYSTTSGAVSVTEPREHRLLLANNLQRSRFSIVYRNNDHAARAALTGGEEGLTPRYFEGLAAGAVVLGTIPDTPDFHDSLGWEDAVVPIGAPEPDIEAVIARLDADPGRLEAARRRNVAESLRRHDWGHRWRTMLDTVGLPVPVALTDRLDMLAQQADALEQSAG